MSGSGKPLPQMDFWDHLDALRGVLLRSAALVGVLTLLLFGLMPFIFERVIMAPCHGSFPLYRLIGELSQAAGSFMPDAGGFDAADFEVHLVNINLASQFFIHMSSSFWLALILAAPAVVGWLWMFVSPALYSHERRSARGAAILSVGMFYMGMAVGYYLVFPLTLRFLALYQLSPDIPNQITLESYISNFAGMILLMGVVFELPVAAWLLGRLGVLGRSFFSTYRRHAAVALLVLAAVVTPTGDPFTLMVVFVPVYALWELSALLVPDRSRTAVGMT